MSRKTAFQRTMTVAPVGKTTAPTAPVETLVGRPSRCVPLVAILYNEMCADAPPARTARATMARTILRIMVGLFRLQALDAPAPSRCSDRIEFRRTSRNAIVRCGHINVDMEGR